jgi:Notch-like protein
MVNIPITDIKLKNTLISLNNNNSSGFDEIPNKIVQVGGNCISKLLAYIFNKSLFQGKFLDHLKFSTVTSLFKNNDGPQIKNYRPVSLLTSFSKTFEILIHQGLVKHISIPKQIFQNNLILGKVFRLTMQHIGLWN